MDEAAWVEAGLLDPAAEAATDRRALLRWLSDRGCSLEQMIDADRRGRLFGLAGDLHARPTRPTLPLAAAAERAGLPLPLMQSMWRGSGLADTDSAEPVLSQAEADTFRVLGVAAAFLGEETVLRLSVSVGTAMRRIAEAVIMAGIDERTDMLLDRSASELATAQVYEAGMSMTGDFIALMGTLFRLHHEAGNRHVEMGLLLGDAPGRTVRLAVGFADLSGYTPLVRTLSRAQLSELVHRFAAWASGVVTAQGGRVIQQLGDAVMFVGSPEATCAAAAELVTAAETDLPPLRAGVAFGDVVLSGGDYFGPVVNLAARLTTDAAPGELLVDAVLAPLLDPTRWDVVTGPARQLKGIDEPEVAATVRKRV